jgi:hypothetical protein
VRKIETIAGFLLVVDLIAIAIIVTQHYLSNPAHAETFHQSIAFLLDLAVVLGAVALLVRITKRQ